MISARIFTSSSGWLVAILIPTAIALPFSIRNESLRRGFGAVRLRPLRLHFLAGYVIVGITLAHSWISMRRDIAGRANRAGLWLATAALAIVLLQVVIGLLLRNSSGRRRLRLARVHFWAMLALVGLAAGHIVLNAR